MHHTHRAAMLELLHLSISIGITEVVGPACFGTCCEGQRLNWNSLSCQHNAPRLLCLTIGTANRPMSQ